MDFLNKIQIRGVVANIRYMQASDQTKIAYMNVITERLYKGTDGTPVIETMFFNVISKNSENKTVPEGIQKGDAVEITGHVRTRKYIDADQIERTVWEIVANEITVCEKEEPLQPETV